MKKRLANKVELDILGSIDPKYKWITRDDVGSAFDNKIMVWTKKPMKDKECGYWRYAEYELPVWDPDIGEDSLLDGPHLCELPVREDMFQCIQWSDEHPTNILRLIHNTQEVYIQYAWD